MRSLIVKIGLLISMPFPVWASTIIVAPGTKVATLKQAIALAKNGDTVRVEKGTYISLNTIVNKELTILGQNQPILDARFQEEVLTIVSGHVKLDGFIIKNSRTGSMRDFAGIRLSNVEFVTISNNTLFNNFFGIYLSNCKNIQVLHNHITGSNNIENSGNGIHLWKCKEILLNGNYVTRHRDGIYFEFAKKCLIENNFSEKNIRYGLHFMFSDDDTYRELALNNGTKWKIDQATGNNVARLRQIAKKINGNTLADYHQVATSLQAGINQMIKECRMKGPDHLALHKWLEPLMEQVNQLKQATTPASAKIHFSEVKKRLTLFIQFFKV